MTLDESRATSPNVPLLLGALEAHSIRYVLIGSVAAQAYGVDVQPGDLDIAPALDADNLARLAQLLLEVDACLPESDVVGQWEVQPGGERKWISHLATPKDL
jgi:hypothetical protein